jgi:hypothetical protein
MIVTNGLAIVYNRAHHAKQEDVVQRGRWSGHHCLEPPDRPNPWSAVMTRCFRLSARRLKTSGHDTLASLRREDFREGVAHFPEKRTSAFTGK